MKPHLLDNPVWASLISRHAHLAVMNGPAGRYPAEVAPFVAVDSADAEANQRLCELVTDAECVYLVGVAPPLESGWRIQQQASVIQMVCRAPVATPPGPQIRMLAEADRDAMLALTALVFPGFFRARTPEMGQYFGIFAGDTLAAMAGERMCCDGYQEISAVCTHPDFLSRGFAARLVAELCNACLERDVTPYLHVSPSNARARALYQRLGFVERAELGLWFVERRTGQSDGQ